MDSTNLLNLIAVNQAEKEVTANENFSAASPAMLYARNAVTSIGLTWGFTGGRVNSVLIANGTLALTSSTTNYIVASRATGAVSFATTITNWNAPATYTRLYKVVTAAAAVTSWEDHRQVASVTQTALPLAGYSANRTTTLADAGTALVHNGADTTPRTFTIDAFATVPWDFGTTLTFINESGAGALTIAVTTQTLRFVPAGTTGSRTLAAPGVATAIYSLNGEWLISGANLT